MALRPLQRAPPIQIAEILRTKREIVADSQAISERVLR
jgi:hypothetical protein